MVVNCNNEWGVLLSLLNSTSLQVELIELSTLLLMHACLDLNLLRFLQTYCSGEVNNIEIKINIVQFIFQHNYHCID